MIECRKCGGSGGGDEPWLRCNKCLGTGYECICEGGHFSPMECPVHKPSAAVGVEEKP